MTKEKIAGLEAADFSLTDTTGRTVCLSDYRKKKNVFLVFNRGFG
jgi:peroxiredoxin